jgi:osmotically-inducible protein OsmY
MVATIQMPEATRDLSTLVLDKIHQVPGLKDAGVLATNDNGLVTLTGFVSNEADRIAAENAARQVSGVKAVADDLQIKSSADRGNVDIAKDVIRNLRSHTFLASEDIKVIVRDGRVILDGVVHQELQKMLAGAQVKRVKGISGLSNKLTVKSEASLSQPIGDTNATAARTAIEAVGYFENGCWVETGEAEAG